MAVRVSMLGTTIGVRGIPYIRRNSPLLKVIEVGQSQELLPWSRVVVMYGTDASARQGLQDGEAVV